jgi:hypothetical protein
MIRNGLCKLGRDIPAPECSGSTSPSALERDRATHAIAVPARLCDFG